MKLNHLILSVLFLGLASLTDLRAATADELVAQGRAYLTNQLSNQNVAAAHAKFASALAQEPLHPTANSLAAVTRLVLLPHQPAVSNLLNRLGVARAGRNLFDWTADFNVDTNGEPVLPSNLNSSEAIALFRKEAMPAIRASLTNLARISNANFLLKLTAEETHGDAVTVDYGDAQLLRALLHASLAFGHTLTAHNFGANISRLQQLARNESLSVARALSENPGLFGAGSASDLADSREELINAVDRYLVASEFIRNTNRPTGTLRLFTLDPLDLKTVADEARFRDDLAKVVKSLDAPVEWDPADPHFLYLGSYFEGGHTLRSFLPRFDRDRYVPGSLPDYTFGGLLVGLPPSEVEQTLLQMFSGGVSGYYASFDFVSIPIAAFVRTNNLVTLIGRANDRPVFLEFRIDEGGYGEFTKGDIFGQAEFGSGNFWGRINVSGASSSFFDGERVQGRSWSAEAGYYQGTFFTPDQSGKLRAIVMPDGRVLFVFLDPSNEPDSGGDAQLGANGEFNPNTPDDILLTGTLNRTTRTISGTFSGSRGDGTFTLSRNTFLTEPAGPKITMEPQDRRLEAGDTATLAVTATGLRLQYLWYLDDLPVWKATARTFSFKPIGPAHTETYSVVVSSPYGSVTSRVAIVTVDNETKKPTVSFTSPANNARVNTGQTTVMGRASDNASVAQVLYSLNGGAMTPADGTNDWTATVMLDACLNIFQVKAVDTSGNESPTGTLRIVRVVNTPLVLRTNGVGKISPNLDGQLLEQCKSYTVTAMPAPGNVFSNWSGGSDATSARLAFTMTSGLTLQANFVPNPFPGVKATYNGLFSEADQVRHEHAGFFSATTTDKGAFSAHLILAGRRIPLNGQFGLNGWATNSVRAGTNTLTIQLQLDLNPSGTGQITGTVSDGTWTARLRAERAYFHATLRPTSLAGAYTLVIPGSDDDTIAPGGDGIGTATVTKGGAVTLIGTLAEGTKIMQTIALSKNGEWPFHVSLHGGKGSILGWMSFNAVQTNLAGELTWTRPGVPASKYYTNGFVLESEAMGSFYLPPGPAERVLNPTNAVLVLSGADLSQTFSNNVSLGAAGKVRNESTNKLAMTITLARGLFSGTFTETNTTRVVKFNGVVLRDQNAGYGFLLGTNRSGPVFFGPREP